MINPIYDLATAVLSAASTALTGTSNGSPDVAYISGVADPAGACCDLNGELVVWSDTLFEFGTFPGPAANVGKCTGPLAVTVSVRLYRCGVKPDNRGVLSADALQAQARWIHEDRWVLRQVPCLLKDLGWTVSVSSLGAAGDANCPGSLLQMTIALRPTLSVEPEPVDP